MSYKKLLSKIILFLLFSTKVFAYQDTSDVNQNLDYKSLRKEFYKNKKDTIKALFYAQKYLVKAKKDNDTLKIANGYYYISIVSQNEICQQYNDSIIEITKKHNTRFYPSFAYRNKAVKYFNSGNFKKAFDYFLKMDKEAKKHNNIPLTYQSKRNIGIIKGQVGEHETALVALRECYNYYSKIREKKSIGYLSTLTALSASYYHNKKLDSATYINHLGYEDSKLLNGEMYTASFVLNEGINQYHKENYIVAKDSITKSLVALEKRNDLVNQSLAHFYLGKTFSTLNLPNKAIEEHKKVNELSLKSPNIVPETRESFEILINHYKKAGEDSKQLQYVERLLSIDSVLNSNYKYLIKNLVQNYDTPQLLSQKEKIINSLKKEKTSSFWMNIVLIIISIISLIFWIYNYSKRKVAIKKFNELYDASNTSKKIANLDKKQNIGISEEIVNDIIAKLDAFEKNLTYLQSDITTDSLSKSFKTNSKYLSKVVNAYKKKSFSTYINDLRIDYSISKLKVDHKFQNYTMKAIAQEIGFNTTQAFSKSFYKKNGIHPSYFIKELIKRQNT